MIDKADVLRRLHASMNELELATTTAAKVIETKVNVPIHIVDRVTMEYPIMIKKQKQLVHELELAIIEDNAKEVSRLVKLVNEVSSMIAIDAKQTLDELIENNNNR